MPDNLSLYNNENYLVRTSDIVLNLDGVDYTTHYEVVNTHTDVVEFRTPVLPEAYRVAVQCDIALTHEHHLWPYKAMDANEEGNPTELATVLQ